MPFKKEVGVREYIVLVDHVEDWEVYFPSEHLMTAKDYLFNFRSEGKKRRATRVINLCKSYKYLSHGYYCSLLAESRNHRVIPSIKVLNDLSRKKLYTYNLDELQEAAEAAAKKFTKNSQELKSIAFRIYFGKTSYSIFKELAQQIFEQFPCPILEIRLVQKKIWNIDSVLSISFTELNEGEEEVFGKALEDFSTKMWRLPNPKKNYVFDLAILTNPEEQLPPSNEEALKNFERVFANKGIYTERIGKKDLARINEFDGLFIRETTSIKNHTYTFSHRAQQEGLVVIDDPESILKCTNKIFMFNLMERNGIPQLPSSFVSDSKAGTLEMIESEFSFPVVLKIPDGSFSLGVKKAKDREELKSYLDEFLKKTSLVLIQKYLPTEFDWRIGVLNGEAIYACRYYMSKGHWQIYNHQKSGDEVAGDSDTLPVSEAPKNVVDTAVKISKLVGNGLYGVDIKEIDGVPMVVEVNDNPSIDEGVEDLVLKDKLYEMIADAFLKH